MQCRERMGSNAVIPVVVLDDVKCAIPTARAILSGGIDIMEITLRTSAGLASIQAVTAECPEMLVGAGTVLNLEQAKFVVEAGAKFVVSPGFDHEIVQWCVENGVTVVPGCITPTEIMAALKLGVDVVKFFPANIYGGLSAMKSLAAPFQDVRFIPTGGVNGQNISEYAAAPFVHTVGGSWVCPKADIAAGNYEKITALCREAVINSLGFEVAHIGINTENSVCATAVAREFGTLFGFHAKDGNNSVFAGSDIEVMKSMYLGQNGHLAVYTNNVARAISYLEKQGHPVDLSSAKFKGARITSVYLQKEIGGFAVHLLQK